MLDSILDRLTASYLVRDVLASAVTPEQLSTGDTIVVTLNDTDRIGVVAKVFSDRSILLKTSTTLEIIKPASQEFIHMIHKATDSAIENLKLRNHTDYERDLKDMTKETHQHDGRPEHSPEIDSDTKIPRSKICLNLKKKASDPDEPSPIR